MTSTVDELVDALRAADGPLSAREIRHALRIPRQILPGRVTSFLADAVATGRVQREGRTTATRYRAADVDD